VALAFADRFINAPAPASDGDAAALAAHFDAKDRTELALAVGLFHGFSKLLIGMGLEPQQMDTTVLPTPQFTTAVPDVDVSDRHAALLADHPDLARRWMHVWQAIATFEGGVDHGVIERCRVRIATLIGVDWAAPAPATLPGADIDPALANLADLAVEMAELFVIDIRAITVVHRDSVVALVGMAGLTHLFVTMAMADGIYRIARTMS
jgi:hypothetical protein